MRKFKAARRALETAVKLSPDNSRAQYYLGLTYLALNNDKKFWQQLTLVRTLEPKLAQRLIYVRTQKRLVIIGERQRELAPQ